jgi:3-phenylpropionate/trans-cinnamate dioxygenase ferredoxin reductase subunit
MTLNSVAVVGASLAGVSAAAALREAGHSGKLVLIGEEEHLPYDRPPLSKELLRGERTAEQIALRLHSTAQNIEWLIGRRATAFDAAERVVSLDDGSTERFDGVVIATGATPRRLSGADLPGVHVLRTLNDAQALYADLKRGPSRVVVVGAGFIGQEVAATCRGMGLAVTMIEVAAPAVHVVGTSVAQVLADIHRARGVDVRLGVAVRAFEGRSRLEAVRLSDGSVLGAEVAVLGIGVKPNTDWLDGSGLTIDDGVVCDDTCLAAPHVVAAGDVARWLNPRYGDLLRIEHWDNAVRQGAYAARRLVARRGSQVQPYAPVPWFWSDQYGLKLQLVGSTYAHDEVRVVSGSATEQKLVALYRRGSRLVAALTLANTAKLLKYRRLLEFDPSWDEALGTGF